MSYASTTLKNFLNEDMGTLKQIADMPKEWKTKLIQNYRAGENSEVNTMDASETPAKLTKFLKDEGKIATILKVDGKTKYYIEKKSPQKFEVMDADEEHSIRAPRRKREQEARDAEWKRQEDERAARYAAANPKPTTESISNPLKSNEVLNERRRGEWHDPALIGEYNTAGLLDFIKKLVDAGKKVELLNIFKDVAREKKGQIRRNAPVDPLERKEGNNYDRGVSPAARKRFEKFEEKKRAQIDKKVDIEIEKFKEQILANFDKAMEDILQQMRKGYGSIDAKSIGEKLLGGVDLNGLKRFQAGYEIISNQYRDIKPKEILDQLKKLGFGPKKTNEAYESNSAWNPENEDKVADWLNEIVEKMENLYKVDGLLARYAMIVAAPKLDQFWRAGMSPISIANEFANNKALLTKAAEEMGKEESANTEYEEMVNRNAPQMRHREEEPEITVKDYSKMDKFEIQKEIDQALDAGDIEKLKRLQKYLPESLKEPVAELLREAKMETNESVLMHQNVALLDNTDEKTDEEDIDEGVSPEIVRFFEGVYSELVTEFEMDEEEAGDFITIVHDELKAAFEDGLMPEEAAALVYTNEEALEKLAKLDPAYQSDFGDENEPTGTSAQHMQEPGKEYEY
jgi:hypothetical protein